MNDDDYDSKANQSDPLQERGASPSEMERIRSERINAMGAELVDLTKNPDLEMQRTALIERMHSLLLESALNFLSSAGWPLPEFYIVACATESSCVEAIAAEMGGRSRRGFYEIYLKEVEVWGRRCIQKKHFIDRWIMRERGVDLRAQALTAAFVEHTLRQQRDERRILYSKIKEGMSDVDIAVKFEVSRREVHRLLQKATEAAARNVEKWTRRFERDSIQFGDGDGIQ